MRDLESTLDSIDRTLAECDASTLPPLTAAPELPEAQAVIDFARATLGEPVPPWQEWTVRALFRRGRR